MHCNWPIAPTVALRKESVDRNTERHTMVDNRAKVALRKESVDRNSPKSVQYSTVKGSLSARRAWIEIVSIRGYFQELCVALRKESVDRNSDLGTGFWRGALVALRKESVDRNVPRKNLVNGISLSLSARRAWIEIKTGKTHRIYLPVALRKESVDRN